MKTSLFKVSDSFSFSFRGPPLDEGPLPALFYFALSAKDSLETDPFNQPVQFLHEQRLRIFSATIPGHEEGREPERAIAFWADKMKQGEDLLTPFFLQVLDGIKKLHEQNYILDKKWGVAGLSRGAFIASHIAALSNAPLILGFAPLTRLSYSKEFQNSPDGRLFDLETLLPALYNRKIRFYIGNCDTRVGTENCFHFVHALANKAQEHRIRSAPIELIIGPSIGYQGHGTAPSVFKAGAEWIKEELLT